MTNANVAMIWASVTQPQLAEIAAAKYRSWPPELCVRSTDDRRAAVAAAEQLAREQGAGNVVRLEVDKGLYAPPPMDARSMDAAALNTALAGAIRVEAEYLGAASDLQIREAERAIGRKFPAAWRNYVQSASWFRRGWMQTGAYVWLYQPSETVECVRAWGKSAENHPGILIIGGDGAGEMLTLDARDSRPRVMSTPNVSAGWEDAIEQAPTIEAFSAAVRDGTFDFAFW